MTIVLITNIRYLKSLRVIILHVRVLIQLCLFGFKWRSPFISGGLVFLHGNMFGKTK